MIRGALVSLVCYHTLDLDATSSAGSDTLTLTSADAEKICMAFHSFHEIWASVIEVALAIWLLQRQIGLGCIGPAVTVLGK